MLAKKKIIFTILSVVIASFIIYIGIGIFDYLEFKEVKAAASGFPLECGIMSTTLVMPGCNRGALGKCTCAMCEASPCAGHTEIQFQAQATSKCNATFFCVDPSFANYTGKIPSVGDQAIVGATSYIIMGNAVYGTPSVAAKGIDKIVNWFDYIIAGIKE